MPRMPRVFVPGATYHVYCCTARGERPFANEQSAKDFVATVEEVKAEHGLTILAWCVMPNHYHLVLRSGELPLWRSMRLIQGRFAKAFNRERKVVGPLWQGRYKARVIEDATYLMQAMAYVHLNPLAGRLAKDPADYALSGHRELIGLVRRGMVDVEEALVVFGENRRAARKSYLSVLGKGRKEGWMRDVPGGLPWWQRASGGDDEIKLDSSRSRMDWHGVSSAKKKPKVDADVVVSRVARVLNLSEYELPGRGQTVELTRARELVMLIGVETFAAKVKELAIYIGRNPGSGSRLYTEAVKRRREDETFAREAARVTKKIMKPIAGA